MYRLLLFTIMCNKIISKRNSFFNNALQRHTTQGVIKKVCLKLLYTDSSPLSVVVVHAAKHTSGFRQIRNGRRMHCSLIIVQRPLD